MNGNNMIMMLLLQQQQQSQPVSALRGGGMMGSSPGHRIGGLKIAAASEALAVIIPAPHQNKGLYAPGLLNARVSNDHQHPLPGYVVPVQASADDAEPLAANKGVELLQEGSGGGGGTDVETCVTSTSTNDFNGNGGAFVAPLGGGPADSAKTSEEEAFPMGVADIRVEQRQQQHPPDSMEALNNFFTKLSGRKLLLVPKASAGRVFSRGLLTMGFEKLCATTASLAFGFASSRRFGGKTPALLSALVTGAGALSVVSAATTSCLSAGTTSADIGSSETTSAPGDLADDATWALFNWITNIGAATALAWSMRVSAVWVLATLAFWARRRSRSRSRKNGASVSPNNPPTAAGTPAAAAAAPAMPPAGTPPVAAAPPAAMPAVAAAMPNPPAPAAAMPAQLAAAMPAPAPGAPPAAAVPAPAPPAPASPAPAPAAAASTASNPVDSHVETPGSSAPASTGPAQPVANAPAAPEPEPRVGRGRKLLWCLRAVFLCSCINETASHVNEAASHVGDALSDVADALGHVV